MSDINVIEVIVSSVTPNVIEVIAQGPPGSPGIGGGALTVREVDGSPSGTATTLVFPNGSVSFAGSTATITSLQETFETVAQNLKAHATGFTYVDGRVTSIMYTVPSVGIAQKIINYTGNKITSIVLANVVGEALPSGISLTKTITYTGDNITGVAYS